MIQAYFIGGPLDLTTKTLERNHPTYKALLPIENLCVNVQQKRPGDFVSTTVVEYTRIKTINIVDRHLEISIYAIIKP